MPLSMNLFLWSLFLLVNLLALGIAYLRAQIRALALGVGAVHTLVANLGLEVKAVRETLSQPPLEVLVARAYDYAVSKAPQNDLALRRTMAAAVKLFDVGGDGRRDFTDAQVAVAVDAFVQRAKGV